MRRSPLSFISAAIGGARLSATLDALPATESATSTCVNWFKSFWKGLTQPLPTEGQVCRECASDFTPRAQQALSLARKEADRFHHNFVGTEHLLLGLIRLGQGTAVTVLGNMGLNLESVRAEVEKQVGTGPDQKIIGN